METQTSRPSQWRTLRQRGSALVATAVVSTILCLMAAGYLVYINHEYYLNGRSARWTHALHLMEAGIEEGLFEMNYRYARGFGFWKLNGWQEINNNTCPPLLPLQAGDTGFSRTVSNFTDTDGRVIGEYTIQVINPGGAAPYMMAKGKVTNFPYGKKAVRVCKVSIYQGPSAPFALFANEHIDMNGNNVETDSYISNDPLYSTNGRYDRNKRRANGNVGTNAGVVNAIAVGNANVYGYAAVGPGGSVTIGPNGNVGPFGTPNGRIAPGYFRDDTDVDLPPVSLPADFPLSPPQLGSIVTSQTITSGDYCVTSIALAGNDNLTLNGNVRLHVAGNIAISGNGRITVAPGSTVQIYVNGNSVSIAGRAIVNNNVTPDKFRLFGMPNVTSMSLNGNGYFCGVIYAPNAIMSLNGGGANGDMCGAIIARRITLNGEVSMHYDEALRDTGPVTGYRVRSWEEVDAAPED